MSTHLELRHVYGGQFVFTHSVDRENISKALKKLMDFKKSVDRLIKDFYLEQIRDEIDALQVELQGRGAMKNLIVLVFLFFIREGAYGKGSYSVVQEFIDTAEKTKSSEHCPKLLTEHKDIKNVDFAFEKCVYSAAHHGKDKKQCEILEKFYPSSKAPHSLPNSYGSCLAMVAVETGSKDLCNGYPDHVKATCLSMQKKMGPDFFELHMSLTIHH